MVCIHIKWYVRSQNGMFIHNIMVCIHTKIVCIHIKWSYVYIQNDMYGRVVRLLPCTYVQFLWTTRKYSGQVVHSTIHMFTLYWTTRPHFKYLGTYGTEEVPHKKAH